MYRRHVGPLAAHRGGGAPPVLKVPDGRLIIRSPIRADERERTAGGRVVAEDFMAGAVGGVIGYSMARDYHDQAKVHDGKPVFFEMQTAYLGGYPHVPQVDSLSSPSWVLVREAGVECRRGDTVRFLIPRDAIRSARYTVKRSNIPGLPMLRWGAVLIDFVAAGGKMATVTFHVRSQLSDINRAKQLVQAINALHLPR